MNRKLLLKLIREAINKELEEVSTSGAAGPYNTPNIFKKTADDDVEEDPFKPKPFGKGDKKLHEVTQTEINKREKDWKERAETMGMTLDKRNPVESDATPKDAEDATKAHEPRPFGKGGKTKLPENRTPRQQIAGAISEIHRQLREINEAITESSRIKNENKLGSTNLWKRTAAHLVKMEGELLEIARKVREMRS